MRRRRRMVTIATPFKHPLVLAVLLYLPLATTGLGLDLRLLLLEPVAWATPSAEAPNYEELDDVERMKLQINDLQGKQAELAWENELLRQGYTQLADLEAQSPDLVENAVLASITVRGDPSNWKHTIYINVGTNDGVNAGDCVTIGRTLIGTVNQAMMNISAVTLITDPASSVPICVVPVKPALHDQRYATAFASGEDNQPAASGFSDLMQQNRGMMKGDSSEKPRIPHLKISGINLESRIAEGMLVVTNDAGGQIPSGLLVGRIERIHNRNDFLEVSVEAAMDLTISDVVTVIKHDRPTLNDIARELMVDRHLDKVEEE